MFREIEQQDKIDAKQGKGIADADQQEAQALAR